MHIYDLTDSQYFRGPCLVIEVDLPEGNGLELHVLARDGASEAAWVTEFGRPVRWQRAASA